MGQPIQLLALWRSTLIELALIFTGAILAKATEWILEWYKNSKTPKSPIVVKADEISSWGWNGEKLLKELINIDKKILGNELTLESREGTIEQWAPLFIRDTDGWSALAINKKLSAIIVFLLLMIHPIKRH